MSKLDLEALVDAATRKAVVADIQNKVNGAVQREVDNAVHRAVSKKLSGVKPIIEKLVQGAIEDLKPKGKSATVLKRLTVEAVNEKLEEEMSKLLRDKRWELRHTLAKAVEKHLVVEFGNKKQGKKGE